MTYYIIFRMTANMKDFSFDLEIGLLILLYQAQTKADRAIERRRNHKKNRKATD